nr:hypothetical protein [uncultured Flavobacterium sp.]
MSRIRIVGGSITKTSKGPITIEVLKGHFISNAAKQNIWDGGENGNTHHEYEAPEKKEEEPKQMAFSGWWSPDYEGQKNLETDNRGSKSSLDKTVYFQLNVSKDIPVGTNITFQLWDKDTGMFIDWIVPDDDKLDGKKVYRNAVVREVDGKHRMTIELFLNPKWDSDLLSDKGYFKNGCLDFYWTWKYKNSDWTSNTNILSVYPSETTLHIKPAYEGYGFPEIRTAEGELIVFSTGIVATQEPSKELEEVMEKILDDIQGNIWSDLREKMVTYSDKLRYTIAVKQLKKGRLVNNMGKIEFSRRIYTKPVFDNSGEVYEITKAANFGYRKDGKLITTKGISQLDYFREVGVSNTIAKASKELLGIFEFSDIINFAMDEKSETIMTGFAPLDFVVTLLSPSITDPIKENWDNVVYNLAEKAKDKGIQGINNFMLTSGGKDQRYRYGIIEINQSTLNKLLKGEFKNLIDLKVFQSTNKLNSSFYNIFYYEKIDENGGENKVIVDSIFINN